MTIKTFQKRVEQAGGKWYARPNGTIMYSCLCKSCSTHFNVLMSTVILEGQLGSRGRYAPFLYLNCPDCAVIPNRYRIWTVCGTDDERAEKISWSKRREEKRSDDQVPHEGERPTHCDFRDNQKVHSVE